ncbi:MAG: DUF5615 family PIN-like protein [Bacteroidetes bacterium]|nr:DUF5615 family PIN-like protein [Bacteroidota bacterium]
MNFTFILDENIDFALIDFFENKGFNVEHIKKIGKTGIKNGEIYRYAEENQMWIITRDKHFQNYDRFITYDLKGVVYLKLSNTKKENLINALDKLFSEYEDFYTKKQLVIIEDESIEFIE